MCVAAKSFQSMWSLGVIPVVVNSDLIFNFFPDPFQLPLWGINKDLGVPHPHLSPQPRTHDVPQVLQNEGIAENDHEQVISPRPHHRLHEHNFDFNRTRNIQEYYETT